MIVRETPSNNLICRWRHWLDVYVTDRILADLAGNFVVWVASAGAEFLKNKLVWANWDAEELFSRAEEIQNSQYFLRTHLGGVLV